MSRPGHGPVHGDGQTICRQQTAVGERARRSVAAGEVAVKPEQAYADAAPTCPASPGPHSCADPAPGGLSGQSPGFGADRHRKTGQAPLTNAVFEPPNPEPVTTEEGDPLGGHDAVRTAAVRDDLDP